MRQTEHYDLRLWRRADRLSRQVLNENFSIIDTVLAGMGGAEEATAAALSQLSGELAEVKEAVAAKTAVTAGVYTGDGESSQTISLGFTPMAVHIEDYDALRATTTSNEQRSGLALPGYPMKSNGSSVVIEVVTGGFRVHHFGNFNGTNNISGKAYYYLAYQNRA